MKTIEYFMVPSSPWTYLGHARLAEIASRHNAQIDIKPFDLIKVFPLSGGLPLPKRAPQRQAYRLAELARWRDFLGLPLIVEPKFFPVPVDAALHMIAAAKKSHGQSEAFNFAGALLKATWAEELDVSDDPTLIRIAASCGLNGEALLGQVDSVRADVDRNTDEAMDVQVFGSPWYRYDGQGFWGQDRLDFLDRALAG